MAVWSSSATMDGTPERVLEVLTDAEACRRFAPVPFSADEGTPARLRAGSRTRVGGRLLGRSVDFDVRILEADDRRLELRACGPIEIEARYEAEPVADRTALRASVRVSSRGGFLGRLLAKATDGLLAAGALEMTMYRIAQEVRAS